MDKQASSQMNKSPQSVTTNSIATLKLKFQGINPNLSPVKINHKFEICKTISDGNFASNNTGHDWKTMSHNL